MLLNSSWPTFLVSKGTIAGDSLKYQALNITGSVLLTINCASSGAWPSVIANTFYLLVGINILFTVEAGLHRPALAPAG